MPYFFPEQFIFESANDDLGILNDPSDEHTQDKLIENWNQIAKRLSKGPHLVFKKLPRLGSEGVCRGLAFVLAEFVKREEEALFYEIYHKICDCNPGQIADEINKKLAKTNEQEQENINAMIDYIYKVNILSRKQYQYPYAVDGDKDNMQRARRLFGVEPNHLRIGQALPTPLKDFSIIQNFDGLPALLKQLNENESYEIGIAQGNITKHSILVYKINSQYHVFNPNIGKKQVCSDPITTASKITQSANRIITQGRDKYTLFDQLWETSNAFKAASLILFPLTFFWLGYDVFFAKSLTPKQLEKPLTNSLWLTWGKVKNSKHDTIKISDALSGDAKPSQHFSCAKS